jgi:hypothetical protein
MRISASRYEGAVHVSLLLPVFVTLNAAKKPFNSRMAGHPLPSQRKSTIKSKVQSVRAVARVTFR